LVEGGAGIDYERKTGLLRTPLQRAAEASNFEIVSYLVDRGALIDTSPVYSGATALQLAAMNGYVGITTFLLEHDANPNYPPAKGEGRTAFEAAAEWGRIDTMSLLMGAGVDLDMQIGDPPCTQYERSVGFAEKNGYMASKRFVQHLYSQISAMNETEEAPKLDRIQNPSMPSPRW
ncbi:ankyrin, partial [Bimuria novae-zelandiae CBS 107.79]